MRCPTEERNPGILVAHAAGELDAETARVLEQHVAGCSACRAVAANQAVVWKALDLWEAPPISPDFDRKLYRRIDETGQMSWWQRLTRPLRPMPLRQVVPLTAMAGLLLAAGFLLERPVQVVPVASRPDVVRASQLERTLDDMELLGQFSSAESAESAHSDAM